MATVLNTLYPPLIDTFMPAFLTEGPATVTFSISPYNIAEGISRIHVSLVSQQTNLNAFAQNNAAAGNNIKQRGNLVDGIWILSFQEFNDYLRYNASSELYTLKIPTLLLRSQSENSENKTFSTEGYYKLQLRFDSTPPEKEVGNDYLVTQRACFSEWSSVCLLKAIPTPQLILTEFNRGDTENISNFVPNFNPGLIPIAGKVYFNNNLAGTYEETMRSYKITIYAKDNPEENLDSIGPVYTGGEADQNNIY